MAVIFQVEVFGLRDWESLGAGCWGE